MKNDQEKGKSKKPGMTVGVIPDFLAVEADWSSVTILHDA